MALIKCEECGKQVSDKAATCPHCGAPVEVIKCYECNKTFSNKEDKCPHCGAPVEEKVEEESEQINKKFNPSSVGGFILSLVSIFFHAVALISILVSIDAVLNFNDKKEKGYGLGVAGLIISCLFAVLFILEIIGEI